MATGPTQQSAQAAVRIELPSKDVNADLFFKVIMIGDAAVGKTSLVSRFAHDQYRTDQKPTIGVEFVGCLATVQGQSMRVQIWDTAGEERFKALTRTYFRGAHGVIACYDVTKRASFDSVFRQWLPLVRECCGGESQPVVMLVGNKIDLADREVKRDAGIEMAKREKLFFMETSAANDSNVRRAFDEIIQEIYNAQTAGALQTSGQQRAMSAQSTRPVVLNRERPSSQAAPPEKKGCAC